jgi:CxxC motif-containing protein (DUF1111 family)
VRKRWLLLACAVGLGCDNGLRAPPGSAWRGSSWADMRAFEAGQSLFRREFTTRQGLGPTFNRASCGACHRAPSLGGASVSRIRKATRFQDGRCDLPESERGDLLQAPPTLYGMGALEAIEEREILRRSDPDDGDGDGISGRPGRTSDGRLGRFGRKSTFAELRAFIESTLIQQMGLTTPGFPKEQSPRGRPLPPGSDPARDPEVDSAAVSQLTKYVQLLAFPPADSTLARRDSTKQGARLFTRIGCAACHIPSLRTGASRIRALHERTVPIYSDLLLHDLGPALAGVCAPGVELVEWRTAPLIGLRLRPQLLHDGRVQTIESAILLHGGEAESSRSLFAALSSAEQEALLRFLRSL